MVAVLMARTATPPQTVVRDDGSTATRIRVQRNCNGCEESLGDATDEELLAAVEGRELPDVRGECPRCKGDKS